MMFWEMIFDTSPRRNTEGTKLMQMGKVGHEEFAARPAAILQLKPTCNAFWPQRGWVQVLVSSMMNPAMFVSNPGTVLDYAFSVIVQTVVPMF